MLGKGNGVKLCQNLLSSDIFTDAVEDGQFFAASKGIRSSALKGSRGSLDKPTPEVDEELDHEADHADEKELEADSMSNLSSSSSISKGSTTRKLSKIEKKI